MPSPTPILHTIGHGSLSGWIGQYAGYIPNVVAGSNGSIRLDMDNEVQPDAVLLLYPGGPSAMAEELGDDIDRLVPELAIEVSVSSRVRDRVKKFRVYEAAGIPEYLIWQVKEKTVEWFRLVDGQYAAFEPDGDGCLKSVVFPGLVLDVPALVAGKMPKVFSRLKRGMASRECREFVRRMRRKWPGE